MSSTKLNLLLNVGFNREVGEEGALYWDKDDLHKVIEESEQLSQEKIDEMDELSTKQVKERFSWNFIVDEYEKVFIE